MHLAAAKGSIEGSCCVTKQPFQQHLSAGWALFCLSVIPTLAFGPLQDQGLLYKLCQVMHMGSSCTHVAQFGCRTCSHSTPL